VGPSSDDFSFDNRLIAHYLQIVRSTLLERKIDKYHFISEQSYQDLCLTLEESNFHNCCDGPDTDCKILRSTLVLPKFLNSRWGAHIKVMDLEGNVIPELSMTQNKFSKYASSKAKNIGWFIHNNYMYVLNNKVLSRILANGLYNDPQQVALINCQSSAGNCPELFDEEFPMDSDLVDSMYKMVLEYLMKSRMYPKDLENDAKDLSQIPSGK
jgi:hypothetical protein